MWAVAITTSLQALSHVADTPLGRMARLHSSVSCRSLHNGLGRTVNACKCQVPPGAGEQLSLHLAVWGSSLLSQVSSPEGLAFSLWDKTPIYTRFHWYGISSCHVSSIESYPSVLPPFVILQHLLFLCQRSSIFSLLDSNGTFAFSWNTSC